MGPSSRHRLLLWAPVLSLWLHATSMVMANWILRWPIMAPALKGQPFRCCWATATGPSSPHRHTRSEEHTSELQSRQYLVCRLLLEKKKKKSLHKTNANVRHRQLTVECYRHTQ